MASEVEWVVTHKARPGAVLERWAIIHGVPGGVSKDAILTALELWNRWPAWQARIGPAGRVDVRKGVREDDTGPHVEQLEWAQLTPETVRFGVQLPGDLHAKMTLAARRRGISAGEFVRGAIGLTVMLADTTPLDGGSDE